MLNSECNMIANRIMNAIDNGVPVLLECGCINGSIVSYRYDCDFSITFVTSGYPFAHEVTILELLEDVDIENVSEHDGVLSISY